MNYAWCNCLNTLRCSIFLTCLKHIPTSFIRDVWKLSMKCGRIDVETKVIMIGFDIVVNKVYSLSV